MNTDMAEVVPAPLVIGPTPAAELGRLHRAVSAQRRSVLLRLREAELPRAVAAAVYDVLCHLALHGRETLTSDLVASFAMRHDASMSELRVPGPSGAPVALFELLSSPTLPAQAAHTVGALFAQGFADRLRPLDATERRHLTVRLVGLLPGVEAAGPFIITDYIDEVCREEDALRFWQVYVDRLAAEINRRLPVETKPPGSTWVLDRLLDLDDGRWTPSRSAAWPVLALHAHRVLTATRHRWRFVRHLLESCHDLRLLAFLCRSPALVEDVGVIADLIARGNAKLVSCAIYALNAHPQAGPAVDESLSQLSRRTFADAAPRMLEIDAQIRLIRRPGAALVRLARGVVQLCRAHLEHNTVEPLIEALANDARALRQCAFFVDLLDGPAGIERARAVKLAQRVLFAWFQSFTPSGVEHPLNDDTWRGAIQRAIAHLLRLESEATLRRLEAFGHGLDEFARRFDDDGGGERTARFAAIWAEAVRGVARILYARPQSRDLALQLYGILLRVFRTHERTAFGGGRFGVAEYLLPGMFPDGLPGEGKEADRLVADAARTIAEIEAGLWPELPDANSPGGAGPAGVTLAAASLVDVSAAFDRTAIAAGTPPLLHHRPSREAPSRASARRVRRSAGLVASLFRLYSGLDVIIELGIAIGRLFSVRRHHEIVLTDRELMTLDRWTIFGRPLRESKWGHALDDLVGMRVVRQMRWTYIAFGFVALLLAAFAGGHTLFTGLRTADPSLMVTGGAVCAFGVVVDIVLNRLAERHRRSLHVEFEFRLRPRFVRVEGEVIALAPLLDAFMTLRADRADADFSSWLDQAAGLVSPTTIERDRAG